MFLFDSHADTLTKIAFDQSPSFDITFEKAQKGALSLQVFALWSGPRADKENVQERMLQQYEASKVLNRQGWVFTTDPSQLSSQSPSYMLSIEGGEIFNHSLEAVETWYLNGIRMSGITWNFENNLGCPAKIDQTKGLTPHGIEVIKELQRFGIAVDTSHLSEKGFYDIFAKTNVAPLASHSCCASLQPHFRNLTDDQIRLLISQGGYIGVNFYPAFLTAGVATIDTVIDHIDHICQLGGEKNVGFGSDFDGIEQHPTDLLSPEDFPNMLVRMKERGYSQESIEDIAGRNFISYFNTVQNKKTAVA